LRSYCNQYVCLSVCLSVCSRNSETTRQNFTIFVHVACDHGLSSFDNVAIRYVLLILWMAVTLLFTYFFCFVRFIYCIFLGFVFYNDRMYVKIIFD